MEQFKMKLLESAYKNIIKEANENTDCHEIMTACLCMMSLNKIKQIISKIENDVNVIPDIIADLHKIANSNKIIGASEDDIESVNTFKYKELALIQACSAAKAILENAKVGTVSNVMLTGKSWDSQIERFSGIKNLKEFFNIDSYGMKDFNSSDIVLVSKGGGKPKFTGVSLKKKKIGEKDPTLINRSLFDSLPTSARDDLEAAFDEFFNKIISSSWDKLIGDEKVIPTLMKKEKVITSKKYPDYLKVSDFKDEKTLRKAILEKCKSASSNPNKKIWKCLLSQSVGLMVTHDNRVHIRSIINPNLLGKNSPFRRIEKMLDDEGISAEMALALMEIIFKGQLYALKDSKFDFALCTGTGKLSKRNGATVGEGEYEPIENVTTEMERLREKGQPTLKITSREDMFEESFGEKLESGIILHEDENDESSDEGTEITIFMKLLIKDESIAVISIRYKGRYTGSPEMLAFMTPQFKQRLMDPVLAPKNPGYQNTEE